MPLVEAAEKGARVGRWLVAGGSAAFFLSILAELVRPVDDGDAPGIVKVLRVFARGGINATFAVGVALVVLRLVSITPYELVAITAVSGYLGQEVTIRVLDKLLARWGVRVHGKQAAE